MTTPYDVAEHLRTPTETAAYLETALEEADGDAAFIAKTMRVKRPSFAETPTICNRMPTAFDRIGIPCAGENDFSISENGALVRPRGDSDSWTAPGAPRFGEHRDSPESRKIEWFSAVSRAGIIVRVIEF